MGLTHSRMPLSRRAWRLVVVGSALSGVALALPAPATAASAAAATTTRVSVSGTGAQANDSSLTTAISADGRYVAFESFASNLVPGDTHNQEDVFVRDRQTGATSRVSVSGTGAQGNGDSYYPSISADGRYVVFISSAPNLVPGDTNDMIDVFVRDRHVGTTRRVSVSSAGVQANADSESGTSAISANGRYIVFESSATNLVPGGDANHSDSDVFLRDVQAGTTRRVSVSGNGAQANASSSQPAVSADGRYVTFGSSATNLVPGDINSQHHVFRHDVQSGGTRLVSVTGAGVQGNDGSNNPRVSAHGRYVTFESSATNLVPGDTNGNTDVFVHDARNGVTRRVSVSANGAQGNGASYNAVISSDGRHVAFESDATNLVAADTNGASDGFIRDWTIGVTRRVSVSSTGQQGNDDSGYLAIGSDGRHVAFRSYSTNLVPGDSNGHFDIFVRVI